MTSQIQIIELTSNDALHLSNLLLSTDDNLYFDPFKFDFDTINNMLSNAVLDKYWGIYFSNSLVGFFMMRGFDSGFEIPSYGVLIGSKYSSKGLATLSLHFAISWAKLNNIKKMILKVHPNNLVAKAIYEKYYFIQSGVDPKNNNFIYYRNL